MKNCEEITVLYEQSKVNRVSISDKISIRTHKTICKDCRQYFKDSDKIDTMITGKFKHLGNYNFSDSEKESLKERLRKI